MADFALENRRIRQVALSAFLLNLILAAVKGVLAHQSGSLAITAGALDSASDSIASLAVFGGLLLSTRKSQAFPLGLYKIENLISVVVAIFIFFAGYEIAGAMLRPPAATRPDISPAMLWWLLGCATAIFLFGQYASHLGRQTGSPTLKAEGLHRQVDVLSSLVVMIAVLLDFYHIDFQYRYITTDRLAALLVLVFIIKAGWELLSDGMRVLLDASIDPATLNKAREIIQDEPAVKEIKSLIGRNAGRFRFLNAEITLKIHDLKKAHIIANRIEDAIVQQIGHVEQVMLHYEPCEQALRRIAFPVLEDGHTICDQFGEAPGFAIWDIRTDKGTIENKIILKNPYFNAGKGKGLHAAHLLMKKDIDIIGVKKKLEFSGPAYLFSDAGIDIRVVAETDATQAVIPFLSMPTDPHSS